MKQKRYETIQQFEEDIKWFQHNCRSIYPQRAEIQAASKELFGFVKDEIQTIQACEECYDNTCEYSKTSVTKQCSTLHLLVWAKSWGSSYTPAKVLAVNFDKEMVIVQFFKDYSTSVLPITKTNCYLYSAKSPENEPDPKANAKALKVN